MAANIGYLVSEISSASRIFAISVEAKTLRAPSATLFGSLETRTMERYCFHDCCLSIVLRKDHRQLLRRQIAVDIFIDQDHGSYRAHPQAAGHHQRPSAVCAGFTGLGSALLQA